MGHIQNVRPALGPRSMLAIAAEIGEFRVLPEEDFKAKVLILRSKPIARNESSSLRPELSFSFAGASLGIKPSSVRNSPTGALPAEVILISIVDCKGGLR